MNWQTLKHASLDDILVWAESQPWCRAMAVCAQAAEGHSEGDVWTHTRMVCQQLAKLAVKCEPPTWSECHTLLLVDGEDWNDPRQVAGNEDAKDPRERFWFIALAFFPCRKAVHWGSWSAGQQPTKERGPQWLISKTANP